MIQGIKLLSYLQLQVYYCSLYAHGILSCCWLRWLNLNMKLNTLTVTQTVWMQACTQAQALDKLQRVKTGRNLLPTPSWMRILAHISTWNINLTASVYTVWPWPYFCPLFTYICPYLLCHNCNFVRFSE